jgi:cell division septum initiation protein DivIVA
VQVHDKLAELAAVLADARAMPMSASCIVNRGEVLALVEQIQQALPADLARAEEVLADRSAVLAEGEREVQRLLEQARAEQHRLLTETEVGRAAQQEADRLVQAAREEAALVRAEVDDYVDAKLANFEVVLNKTMQAVIRGRDRLRGLRDVDELETEAPDPSPGTRQTRS